MPESLLRPGELSAPERELRAVFLAEVERIPGGDRLRRCIQCGTCSGSCPVSHQMDVQPRQIVAYFRAGDLASILRSRTLWLCASCYACTVRCPANIKITDLIYALKRMAIERGPDGRAAPARILSREFVDLVGRLGRNHEMRLLLRYGLRRRAWRLLGMAPLGFKMLRAGRLPLGAKRVKDLAGLRRILKRAERIDQEYIRESTGPLGTVGYAAVAEVPTSAQGGAA